MYDNVQVAVGTNPQFSTTGAVVATGAGIDTLGYNTAALRVITTPVGAGFSVGNGSSLVAVLQEAPDNVTWTNALDNTGTVIGGTIQVTTTAVVSSYRIEGLGLNRKRFLRVVLTPNFGGTTQGNAFTSSSVVELGRAYNDPVAEGIPVSST